MDSIIASIGEHLKIMRLFREHYRIYNVVGSDILPSNEKGQIRLLQFVLSKIPVFYAYFTTVLTSPPIFGGYALKNAPTAGLELKAGSEAIVKNACWLS